MLKNNLCKMLYKFRRTYCLSLKKQKKNLVFGFWLFGYDVSAWNLFSSLDVWINVFTKLGSFQSFFLHIVLSAPFYFFLFWNLSSLCWYTWWCPTGPCSFILLSSFFFSLFLRQHNLKWPIFKFVDFSASSDLLLSPSSELFISIIVFFNSRIFGVFYI